MLHDAKIEGQHPFEVGYDSKSNLNVSFVNGSSEVKTLFGKTKERPNYYESEVKVRICPKCGKIELYIDLI